MSANPVARGSPGLKGLRGIGDWSAGLWRVEGRKTELWLLLTFKIEYAQPGNGFCALTRSFCKDLGAAARGSTRKALTHEDRIAEMPSPWCWRLWDF